MLIVLFTAPLALAAQKKEATAGDHFRRWLDEDVAYIITDDERAVFEKLTTPEERSIFIEQFWLRRDPDPSTPANEFKEDHYRRIAYANEKFSAGIRGWKTDRGRIYIMYGPPNQVESRPAGGPYVRETHEGGGETSVFPFERWWYRYIPGVGSDIEIEFVDRKGGGLYQIALSPDEKDELLYMPGGGLNMTETAGISKKYRIAGHRIAGDAPWNPFERVQDRSLEKFGMLARLNQPPAISFRDLAAVVSSKITFNQLPFHLEAASFRGGADETLVPLTLEIPNRELQYRSEGDIRRATLLVYGRVSALSGRIVSEFEDTIAVESTEERFREDLERHGVYEKRLRLPAGVYRLDLVLKEVESGRIGTREQRLEVARFGGDRLSVSSLILCREFEPAGGGPFVFQNLKVRPSPAKSFRADGNLGLYLQVYNFARDPSSGQPALQLRYAISKTGAAERPQWKEISTLAQPAEGVLQLARLVPLAPYAPGKYRVEVRVIDRLSQQSASIRAEFQVEP